MSWNALGFARARQTEHEQVVRRRRRSPSALGHFLAAYIGLVGVDA